MKEPKLDTSVCECSLVGWCFILVFSLALGKVCMLGAAGLWLGQPGHHSLLVAGTFDAEPLLSFPPRFLMPDQAVKVLKEQICI